MGKNSRKRDAVGPVKDRAIFNQGSCDHTAGVPFLCNPYLPASVEFLRKRAEEWAKGWISHQEFMNAQTISEGVGGSKAGSTRTD